MRILLIFFFFIISTCLHAQEIAGKVRQFDVAEGWANNSVNAIIFRKNSIVTHGNTQYIAFYDPEKYMVLAKRKLGKAKWQIERTPYKGNTNDAHNSISIMVDGKGYLHISWDHHNDSLRYAKSIAPGSLALSPKLSMTGKREEDVTYPEFYRLPDGDLLFFYRSGESGRGDLVINRYSITAEKWEQIQSNLIDGEGERNAYWQAFVDSRGTLHLSWVWRETWDVATNHDLCYARSTDGGKTWENSKGEKYGLPINQEKAEIAFPIPQNSELINQTSMAADKEGNPVIATYWRDSGTDVPQFHVVYCKDRQWTSKAVSERKSPFSLSGGGTKSIPISRPQILIGRHNEKDIALMIFRDKERGNKPSMSSNANFPEGDWTTHDLSDEDLGSWEPSFDTELWENKGILGLFIQKVEQIDGEGVASGNAQMVKVLEWKLK